MNSTTFTYLLDHPKDIKDDHLEELGKVISAFPFFQSARALELKALKDRNSFRYNEALKKTAAYTSDRDILFEYITSEAFVQNAIATQIQQHDASVDAIEVTAENVSEQLSIELDNRIKAELKKAEAILNPDLFERKIASVAKLVEGSAAASEEVSAIDRPLNFQKEDMHSFGEWLKLTAAVPIKREEGAKDMGTDAEKMRKFKLIDKFIQERPKISPASEAENLNDLSDAYTQTPDTLMTETLARVYTQQRNYKKALQAYNILILKYPEKSGFFADQIRAIKKLINSEAQ